MPPETNFWDPRVLLPYSLRSAMKLFERELAQCTRFSPAPSEFIGMVDGYPESFYDLLSSAPDMIDSDSSSTGSNHPSQKCNMLHRLGLE